MDFNLHYDSSHDSSACKFRELLFSLNLHQSVDKPTHDKCHTLDLVITRQEEAGLVKDLSVLPSCLSDHAAISFHLPYSKPRAQRKKITTRNMKDLNIEKLKEDIEESDLLVNPPSNLDSLVKCYNRTLKTLLNKYAPEREKEVVLRPHAPWYDEKIQLAKQERRRAERQYKKTELVVHKEILKFKQRKVNEMCTAAKILY